METLTKTIYKTADGKEFTDQEEAQSHEKAWNARHKNLHWFIAHHGADLTEGRGYQCVTIIAVESSMAKIYAEQYAIDNFGRKIQYAQGVAPVPGWYLTKKDEKPRMDNGAYRGVGDMKVNPKVVFLSDNKKPHPDTDLPMPRSLDPERPKR